MSVQILGKVGVVPKGAYNNSTEYEKLDIVTYNGQSYMAKGTTTGNLPTDTTYWQLLAEKGEDGNTPVKGIDYWTNQDKAEMVSDVVEDITPILNTKVDKNVNNLTYYTLKTSTGSLIDLEINGTTYVVTLKLKDIDGNVISTDTIDLPLESVVVSGSFDNVNKRIVLTLQNGSTINIPVGDLVAGLQTEITSSNKLASDLIDDTNSGNKFVTSSEKQTWNGKQEALISGTNIKTINNENLLGAGNINLESMETLSFALNDFEELYAYCGDVASTNEPGRYVKVRNYNGDINIYPAILEIKNLMNYPEIAEKYELDIENDFGYLIEATIFKDGHIEKGQVLVGYNYDLESTILYITNEKYIDTSSFNYDSTTETLTITIS